MKKQATSLGATLLLCAAIPAHAESIFDQIFKKDGQYSVPGDITQVRARINQYAREKSVPPVTSSVDDFGIPIDLSIMTLIPQGRSLQNAQTDYENPRVVFSMDGIVKTRAASDASGRPGKLVAHRNSLSEKLFIGFSPNARSLEVISWDPAQGGFRFFVAKNYPRGLNGEAPQYLENPKSECIKCHQNEGPIFPRAPWSETNSLIETTMRICEKHPSGTYLGQKFADDCNCSKLPDGSLQCDPTFNPVFPTRNDLGETSAQLLNTSVRRGNRQLQARALCQTICGNDGTNALDCRKALLESALRFSRSTRFPGTRNQKNFAIIDYQTRKLLERAPISSSLQEIEDSLGLENSTNPARIQALRTTLDSCARKNWPSNDFAYRADVLADRNPLTSPMTFLNAQHLDGSLNFDSAPSNVEENVQLAQFDLTGHIVADGSVPLGGDPSVLRPLANGLSKDLAAPYAMEIAFSCLGFDDQDAVKFQSCADKTPGGIDALIASKPMQEAFDHLARTWPLAGPAGGSPSAEIQSRILGAACGQSPEPSAFPSGTHAPGPIQSEEALKQAMAQATLKASGSATRAKAVLNRCMECHDGNGTGDDFTDGTEKPNLKYLREDPSLLQEMLQRMRSQGKDHMPKGDFDRLQTIQDAADLEAWTQGGAPLEP